MFICAMVGVIIVSIMVVAIMNELEMTNNEAKAYTVISKIQLKRRMTDQAACIISKAMRLYTKIKKEEPISAKLAYDLNSKLIKFKKYRK